MTIPNLINPIFVEIKQIDETKTVYNNRKREPANRVKRSTSFKIQSQIFFGKQEYVDSAQKGQASEQNLAGAVLIAEGYIIVRSLDLQVQGKTLSPGDKLVSYGNIGQEKQCEYYLIGKKDAAHYSDQGNCTLERWYFADRN